MFWVDVLGRIFGAKRGKVTGGWRKSSLGALEFVDQMMTE
jgi:hypothetical protein